MFLTLAEEQFGPRDRSWTFIGIHVGMQPGSRTLPDVACSHVSIELASRILNSPEGSLYELAHETVHLLGPSDICTRLEEGVAVVFSDRMMEWSFALRDYSNDRLRGAKNYRAAAEDVRILLASYPDVIRQVREVEPTFGRIRYEHFETLFPGIDAALVGRLLQPFPAAF